MDERIGERIYKGLMLGSVRGRTDADNAYLIHNSESVCLRTDVKCWKAYRGSTDKKWCFAFCRNSRDFLDLLMQALAGHRQYLSGQQITV